MTDELQELAYAIHEARAQVELPWPASEGIASWARTLRGALPHNRAMVFEMAAAELSRLAVCQASPDVRQAIVDRLHDMAVGADIDPEEAQAIMSLAATEAAKGRPPPVAGDDWDRPEVTGHVNGKAPIAAFPFKFIDPATIQPRERLYGWDLIRRFVSGTVAPGAAGKTTLILAETLAQVTGRALLGKAGPASLRVWYWNLEDPRDEIDRRLAGLCLQYDIGRDDLGDRLFVNSGRDAELILAKAAAGGVQIAQPVTDALLREIKHHAIDVLVIDPFVNCHDVGENDNGAIARVIKLFAGIAEAGNCAVMLVHHVRKLGESEATVESARGASAFIAGCRSVRVLNGMSKEEGERFGIENHRRYFRVYNGKSNMAPPSTESDWYALTSVDLMNGPPGASDSVQGLERWKCPSAFDDVSARDLLVVQKRIAGAEWRESEKTENWAGIAVADALELDLNSAPVKMKVKTLLKTWVSTGALRVIRKLDEHRKERPFIEVGQWFTD